MKSFPGRLKLKSAQHQSTHHQCCDASWQRAGAICPVSLNKSSIIHLVFIIGTWVRFFFYSVTAVVRSSLAGVEIIAAITLARFRPHAMSTTHGSIHLLAERVRVRAALPLHHNVVTFPYCASIAPSVSSFGFFDDQGKCVFIILKSKFWTFVAFLVPHVPLCFLALSTQFCGKSDFIHSSLLYLSINRLLNPFNFFHNFFCWFLLSHQHSSEVHSTSNCDIKTECVFNHSMFIFNFNSVFAFVILFGF